MDAVQEWYGNYYVSTGFIECNANQACCGYVKDQVNAIHWTLIKFDINELC